MDTSGNLIVRFTEPISIPDDFADQVNNQTAFNREQLEQGLKPIEVMLDVLVVFGQAKEDGDLITYEPLLKSWSLEKAD